MYTTHSPPKASVGIKLAKKRSNTVSNLKGERERGGGGERNRSRGRYRCGAEVRVTVAKRGLCWSTCRRVVPTRQRKGTKSIVIPGCLVSSHGSGKIRANHLSQSLAKEDHAADHADPCTACSMLVTRNEARTEKIAIIADIGAPALRELPRCGSGGVKFRHGLAPGSEKVSDNDIVFRQYYTNRQEKFWSNPAHKQHHQGATTRPHAGIVALID